MSALLLFAPHQIVAQSFGEPRFAGGALDHLLRSDNGKLAHPAMQREAPRSCQAVGGSAPTIFADQTRTKATKIAVAYSKYPVPYRGNGV